MRHFSATPYTYFPYQHRKNKIIDYIWECLTIITQRNIPDIFIFF